MLFWIGCFMGVLWIEFMPLRWFSPPLNGSWLGHFFSFTCVLWENLCGCGAWIELGGVGRPTSFLILTFFHLWPNFNLYLVFVWNHWTSLKIKPWILMGGLDGYFNGHHEFYILCRLLHCPYHHKVISIQHLTYMFDYRWGWIFVFKFSQIVLLNIPCWWWLPRGNLSFLWLIYGYLWS